MRIAWLKDAPQHVREIVTRLVLEGKAPGPLWKRMEDDTFGLDDHILVVNGYVYGKVSQ